MEKLHAAHIDAVFGQIIVKYRTDAGFDQSALADRLGIHQTALSRLERGESPVNMSMLVRLGDALNDLSPSTISAKDLISDFDDALKKLKSEDIKVASKKELSKDNSGLALLLGGAAIAFLISR